MGYIDSTIRLRNEMSPVLSGIVQSMNMVVGAAYDMNRATGASVDLSSLNAARDRLREIEAEIERASREQENFNNEIANGANQVNKLGNFIKSAVGAYVGFRGVNAFVNLSDDMTNIRVRLDMINDGTKTTKQLQDQIFASAQRARGEYKTTLDIVTKLGMQAKDAFKNNGETVAFAENLNKLFTISGTSAQGMESVMYNLTQAMGSGVLRGQDLNAVMANTPLLLKIVSDYMGVSIGEIRGMASEGKLSADVIKNALLGAGDEINARFEKMPLTFGQIFVDIKNRFIYALEPALAKLSEFANSEGFRVFVNNAVNAAVLVADAIGTGVEYVVMFANMIAANWGTIEPLIFGIVMAFLALKVATLLQAAAMAVLNANLLISPIGLIIAGVAIIITLFVSWANSVGGVRVAVLILHRNFIVALRGMHLFLADFISKLFSFCDMGVLYFHGFTNGITDAISNAKVLGLFLLEEFVNGAIDGLNSLINVVNSVPGVSIPAFKHFSFAAEAKIKSEAEKQIRDRELKEHERRVLSNRIKEDKYLKDLEMSYDNKINEMNKKIADLKAEKQSDANENIPKFDIPNFDEIKGLVDDVKSGVQGTQNNTSSLADGIKVKDDDISYLKDLAEIRAITNFSFEKIQVNVDNKFGDINQTADLDGWMESLTDSLTEAVNSTMGGISAYGI